MFNSMPNTKNCGPHDDCDLTKTFKNCHTSEKVCRFAYASWCPICDVNVPRRRSKSECKESNSEINNYRKRGREFKMSSPKKTDSSENGEYMDIRDKFDSTRIRTNLCELPTTYINNCQSNVPLSKDNTTYPIKYSNFVEPLYDNRHSTSMISEINKQKKQYPVKNSDSPKKNGISRCHFLKSNCVENCITNIVDNKQTNFLVPRLTTHETIPHEKSKFLSPKKQYIQVQEINLNSSRVSARKSVEKYDKLNTSRSVLDTVSKRNTEEQVKKQIVRPSSNTDTIQFHVYSDTRLTKECTKRLLPTPNIRPKTTTNYLNANLQNFLTESNTLCLDSTENEIDLTKNNSIKPNKSENNLTLLRETESITETDCSNHCILTETNRNDNETVDDDDSIEETNEIREIKRNRVRPRSDSDYSNDVSEKVSETNITKKAREISPLQAKKEFRTKNAVKLASIKNRHKISATKLRKVRSKIAHSVSSDSNLSEDSDFEETEDEELSKPSSEESLAINNEEYQNGSTPTHKFRPDADLGPFENWPIRPSLFPNVPPYINFASHDSETQKLPPGVSRYFKWRLSNITPVVVRKTLINTGFRLVRSEYSRESNDWSGTWGKHLKSVCFQNLKDSQKLNHFPGTFQIGRKDRLWKNLQRLMFKFGLKEFGFIPRTFVLPHDLKLLRQSWEKTGHEKWIIKPPASARGTGIKVIHRWAHLPKKKSLVVQQYISNPYLINGSKFDLRLYVLVTSFNPLRIYLYPEGLARFASTKYSDDLSTLSDRYMHLTNYSINKLSSHYSANEDANACKGHKWTLSKLWEYLEKEGVNTKILWRSLQQLVIKTMLCGESSISALCKVNVNSRYNCYELFGVDVLLDERLKAWLLEVNISPSLHSASPLDLHVKGPLVQSLLNLAQFHLSPKLFRLQNTPSCLNTDLYTTQLTTKERLKHLHFTEFEKRDEYLHDILTELTGDDVRHLIQAEDELTVAGNFERIFPTQHTYSFFQFMETRYYNRLFDAWENRYEKNRTPGITLLQSLCEKRVHLIVAPASSVKNLSAENSRVSSPETTTSEDSVQSVLSKRTSSTNPVQVTVDPTINALRNEIRYKMMNLNIDMGRAITPF